MTVVVALGGSVVVPETGEIATSKYASQIERAAELGHPLCIVVGGGATARTYIDAGRDVNMPESTLDRLGIEVSRLNARLLANSIDDSVNPQYVTSYEKAAEAVRQGAVPVMGGTTPGHTTDAVAAVLAEDVGAELVIYGTTTDGVYDADPATADNPTRYDEMTQEELVDLLASSSRSAGASAPIDLLAAKLLERSKTTAAVVNAEQGQFLVETLRSENIDGTLIRAS